MELLKWRTRSAAPALARTFAAACVASLSACGNSDISKLKAQTIDANPSFTIGQAFDHRNACDSVSWKESTDDRGRKVIEYRCTFKVDKSYYENLQQKQIAQLNQQMQADEDLNRDSIQREGSALEQRKQRLDQDIKGLEQSYATNPRALAFQEDELKSRLDGDVATYEKNKTDQPQTLANIQNNYQSQIANVKSQGHTTGATEVFQWAVNDGGFATIYAGLDIQKDNGKALHQGYSGTALNSAITAIVRNDAKDLGTYASELL